ERADPGADRSGRVRDAAVGPVVTAAGRGLQRREVARPRSAEHGRHRGGRRAAPTMPLVAAGAPADGEMADLAGAAVSAVHPPAVHDDAAADALAHAEDGERARAVAGPEPVVRGGESLHV